MAASETHMRMTPEFLTTAAVLAFFDLFGLTLFGAWVWTSLAPTEEPRPETIRARRPISVATTDFSQP